MREPLGSLIILFYNKSIRSDTHEQDAQEQLRRLTR